MNNEIKITVLESANELGLKVDNHLRTIYNTDQSFILPAKTYRFANGEGKASLEESVRGTDLYIMSDVGNYSINYPLQGITHYMSPDEHFQDLKRVIMATSGHTSKISVIEPLLYEGRQHRRKGRESMDCAVALQELANLGISEIVTFDAHDPNISNAIPRVAFDNFFPTEETFNALIQDEPESFTNLFVIGPDQGAFGRARYYAEIIGVNVGIFYKRRDISRIVNGKNPIIDHAYLGDPGDINGHNIIIVDDMIASGNSVLEISAKLKEMGAKKIFIIATFALFTEGLTPFEEAYQKGYFDAVYSTNLTYVNPIIKTKKWYHEIDSSSHLAEIISYLHEQRSIEPLINKRDQIVTKVRSFQKDHK